MLNAILFPSFLRHFSIVRLCLILNPYFRCPEKRTYTRVYILPQGYYFLFTVILPTPSHKPKCVLLALDLTHLGNLKREFE